MITEKPGNEILQVKYFPVSNTKVSVEMLGNYVNVLDRSFLASNWS